MSTQVNTLGGGPCRGGGLRLINSSAVHSVSSILEGHLAEWRAVNVPPTCCFYPYFATVWISVPQRTVIHTAATEK